MARSARGVNKPHFLASEEAYAHDGLYAVDEDHFIAAIEIGSSHNAPKRQAVTLPLGNDAFRASNEVRNKKR